MLFSRGSAGGNKGRQIGRGLAPSGPGGATADVALIALFMRSKSSMFRRIDSYRPEPLCVSPQPLTPSGDFAAKQKGPKTSQTKGKFRLLNDFVSQEASTSPGRRSPSLSSISSHARGGPARATRGCTRSWPGLSATRAARPRDYDCERAALRDGARRAAGAIGVCQDRRQSVLRDSVSSRARAEGSQCHFRIRATSRYRRNVAVD